jgi:hypothetical protein
MTTPGDNRPRDDEGRPLAPAVAIVGPAASGKTTILHLLDRDLQHQPEGQGSYVVKGSPDGTGRYLFYSPESREQVKARAKGAWSPGTIEALCAWTLNARRCLELVLVDVGGKHASENALLFSSCSHFIVVARRFDDVDEEREKGMASWVRACQAVGLILLARVRSVQHAGDVRVETGGDGVLDATFRSDASRPGDRLNDPLVQALVERLIAIRLPRDPPPYVDLHLGQDWAPADIPGVGGRVDRITSAARSGDVCFGGSYTPIWAYALALHRALDVAPHARMYVFDPKLPYPVEIPARLAAGSGHNPWPRCVDTRWRWIGPAGPDVTLDVRVTTENRLLPAGFENDLSRFPLPDPGRQPERIVLSGVLPIWLHLTLSRAVRTRHPHAWVGVWDERFQKAVMVGGPGPSEVVEWPSPNPG